MTGVSFLELEITGKCSLRCAHCYAESSPHGDHSVMTTSDWERVIDDARTAGVTTVQFIGGEPTMHPDLPWLVRYALAAGPVGRASQGQEPTAADLCGQCGNGRAAIGSDGTVHPCVLGRFLTAGNVNEQSG